MPRQSGIDASEAHHHLVVHRISEFMRTAIAEAQCSLRENNSGFGAVIIRGDQIISQAHDTDTTSGDPTAHAEMSAIRSASARLGKDLSGCHLIATHEPCPMCSTAILWAGITEVTFGYSIKESIEQGRKRINLSLAEIIKRAGTGVQINEKSYIKNVPFFITDP